MTPAPALKPYRPSNGTEGEGFIGIWCAACARDVGHNCSILARTLMHDVDDPEYPKEWVEDNIGPRCTAFVPLSALTDRAKRAWESRRKTMRDAFAGDLFSTPTKETR